MNTKNKKVYEGLGFIESLIAIAVAGIASVVLLSISTNTLKQITNNEISDTLTQKAIQGAGFIRNISYRNIGSEEEIFPVISENINKCFAFYDTEPSYFFKEGDSYAQTCNYDNDPNNECEKFLISDDVFRVFCITDQSDPNTGLLVGKVVTGIAGCDESTQGKCALADYQYYTIFRTTEAEDYIQTPGGEVPPEAEQDAVCTCPSPQTYSDGTSVKTFPPGTICSSVIASQCADRTTPTTVTCTCPTGQLYSDRTNRKDFPAGTNCATVVATQCAVRPIGGGGGGGGIPIDPPGDGNPSM